jgi:hypothetical protein
MKKLFVLAVSAMMIFAMAGISMAAVTVGGEIDGGYKSYSNDVTDKTLSMPYIYGKVGINGQLGNNVTGTLVINDNDEDITNNATTNRTAAADNINNLVFDEASVTFAESFGNIKVGYFPWNNNLKDILDTYRNDLQTDCAISGTFKLGGGLSLGAVYAIPTTDAQGKTDGVNAAQYGADLAYTTDSYGADLIYTSNTSGMTNKDGDAAVVMGAQGWYKIGNFKPFVQYEIVQDTASKDDPTNTIVGATYESASNPVYARAEYDLSTSNDKENAYGVRAGYKLASGVKIEGQYYANVQGSKDSKDYLKVVCPF